LCQRRGIQEAGVVHFLVRKDFPLLLCAFIDTLRCPDGGSKIAIAYCNLEFQATLPDTPKESFIFHVEDPTVPNLTLHPPYFLVSVEYNPKDYNVVAGGCYNGQVCWWDVRQGGSPAATIGLQHCHADPVYKTIWLNAKTGAEFFTASTDGTVSEGAHERRDPY